MVSLPNRVYSPLLPINGQPTPRPRATIQSTHNAHFLEARYVFGFDKAQTRAEAVARDGSWEGLRQRGVGVSVDVDGIYGHGSSAAQP